MTKAIILKGEGRVIIRNNKLRLAYGHVTVHSGGKHISEWRVLKIKEGVDIRCEGKITVIYGARRANLGRIVSTFGDIVNV